MKADQAQYAPKFELWRAGSDERSRLDSAVAGGKLTFAGKPLG